TARGAKDDAGLAERVIDRVVPPTAMPEFDDVPPARDWPVLRTALRDLPVLRTARGAKLRDNSRQSRPRIAKAGRKLIQQASHPRPKQIGDKAEVADEGLGAAEALRVRDQLADF